MRPENKICQKFFKLMEEEQLDYGNGTIYVG